MIISAFKKIRHYFMFAIESRYMNVSAVSESWILDLFAINLALNKVQSVTQYEHQSLQ